MKTLIISLLLSLAITSSLAHKAAEWRSRSIYQLLTDRFSTTNGDKSDCADLGDYCGGTFKGIINNLDYISGMGFDAIWISPVVANTDGGYHGYWAQNIFEINPEFGTADELKQLVDACHARDIWVMVDVVGNHMGNMIADGDFTDKVPFNHSSYYHPNIDCSAIDQNNENLLQTCWLAQLPDLNQDHDFVRETLYKWITNLITTYKIDGIRIDTVPYVSKHFWKGFTDAAAVYTLGEVFNSNLTYDAGYEGPLDGVLNYPLFDALRYAFQANNSMNRLKEYYKNASTTWPDTELLGNFVDNHDNARFLSAGDRGGFKSALAFCLTAVGIPITYYGSEQEYNGGNDPQNREALWTNMNTESEIYKFLKTINTFRKQYELYKYPQVERYSDDNFYAFSRGNALFAFTNRPNQIKRTIGYHSYQDGTELCNILSPGDCVKVNNGQLDITMKNGEVKIYTPLSEAELSKQKSLQESNRRGEFSASEAFLKDKTVNEAKNSNQYEARNKMDDAINVLSQLYVNLRGAKNNRANNVE